MDAETFTFKAVASELGLKLATGLLKDKPRIHVMASPPIAEDDLIALCASFSATHYWPTGSMSYFTIVRDE